MLVALLSWSGREPNACKRESQHERERRASPGGSAGTRFQVDLVPAHSVLWLFLVDSLHAAVDPIYNEAVKREITSYDRHGDFQPGLYVLGEISPTARIGAERSPGGPSTRGSGKRGPTPLVKRGHTVGVRTAV